MESKAKMKKMAAKSVEARKHKKEEKDVNENDPLFPPLV